MVKRIFDIVEHQLSVYRKQIALAYKVEGQWKTFSSADFKEQADLISCGLLALGIKKDDKIAVISNNRPEWNFADIGAQQLGAILVPMYTSVSSADYKFILNDSSSRIIFCGDKELYNKVMAVRSELTSVEHIYTFDNVDGAEHWSAVTELGKRNFDAQKLQQLKDTVSHSDIATILYTSGTTGIPKGVMLTHDNIISNVAATEDLMPVTQEHRALSFLPLCHSYERMLTYLYMYMGISIYYAESMEKIADNLKEVKPQIFSTVPRLLEKVYDRILEKGKALTGIKKALFFWALNLGLRYELNGANGWWYERQLKLANKIIFSKWREALGGEVRVIVSGSAALQPRLARVFWSAGINVLEGYGLTETSPVVAVNNLHKNAAHFGTVGPVIQGVTVKIAEDGEILVKGPNVMKGYYKRPDLTDEVIDKEGWFHTGDIGTMVENRFLKITDRKKEIFKTSGGKYIAPQMIENKLKESPFIEQVMVIGENQKFPSALIVPSFLHLKKWCEENGIQDASNEELVKNPKVIEEVKQAVDKCNSELGSFEQIKKFEVLPREWTIDSGELTATLKMKRKVIMEHNKQVVEKIYGQI
jgi:long-chain acyl-CoA synthetase